MDNIRLHREFIRPFLFTAVFAMLAVPGKSPAQQGTGEELPFTPEQAARQSVIYYNAGVKEENLGDSEKAVELYETSLSFDPMNVPALERVHDIRIMQGKEDSIRTALETLSTVYPGNQALKYLRARLLDPGEADSILQDITNDNPLYYWGYFGLGQNYMRQGLFEEAAEQFGNVLALNPVLPEAQLGLGVAYYNLGDFQRALRQYEKALIINPGVIPEAYFHLGMLYNTQKDTNRTTENFQKYIDFVKNGSQVDLARSILDSIEVKRIEAALLEEQMAEESVEDDKFRR